MDRKREKRTPDKESEPVRAAKRKGPLNPYLVLAVAIVLPGVGQVLNNTPVRGLIMIFFMLVGAWVCYNTTTPEQSFLGRYAAGWFVYAMSILDAYRWAKYRSEYFETHGEDSPGDA